MQVSGWASTMQVGAEWPCGLQGLTCVCIFQFCFALLCDWGSSTFNKYQQEHKRISETNTSSCRAIDIVTSDFVQVLHVNNNHWVYVRSINYAPGHVYRMDSPSNSVLSQEIVDLFKNSLSPSYKGINQLPIQQQLNEWLWGFCKSICQCLVYGLNPSQVHFNIPMMRPYLLNCFKACAMRLLNQIYILTNFSKSYLQISNPSFM